MKNAFKLIVPCLFLFSCASKLKKLEKSANNGNSGSQYSLYHAYLNGSDKYKTKRDTEKAQYWLEKSARKGNVSARKTLLQNHIRGHNGYSQSIEKATDLALAYGRSLGNGIPSIYSEKGARSFRSTLNQMDNAFSEMKADCDRRISSAGSNTQSQINIYNGFLKDIERDNIDDLTQTIDDGIDKVNFFNYLNKLNLEGVNFPVPDSARHLEVARIRADMKRLADNYSNIIQNWRSGRSNAITAKNLAELQSNLNKFQQNNSFPRTLPGRIQGGVDSGSF